MACRSTFISGTLADVSSSATVPATSKTELSAGVSEVAIFSTFTVAVCGRSASCCAASCAGIPEPTTTSPCAICGSAMATCGEATEETDVELGISGYAVYAAMAAR